MKLLKRISMLTLVVMIACTPILATEVYTRKEIVNGIEKLVTSKNIRIYSDVNNWLITSYAPIVDNTTFIEFRELTTLLGYDYGFYDGSFGGTNPNGNGGFKVTAGNKGALINGQYTLLPIAPYIQEKSAWVPLKAIVEALGKTFTYDANTNTYIICEKGQPTPKIPSYPEKKISVYSKHIWKSTTIDAVFVNDTICVSLDDLEDIMGLFIKTTWDPKVAMGYITEDNAYSSSIKNLSFDFNIGEKEILVSNGSKILLPFPSFSYIKKGSDFSAIYIPLKAVVEGFGKTLTYNSSINHIEIK